MELLKTLYKIQSKSRQEDKMKAFLMSWFAENIPAAKVESDKKGNIYVTKGESQTYPCIASHIDQVQMPNEHFEVVVVNNVLLGVDTISKDTHGLGADDKNGIWIALKALLRHGALKAVFFVEEEIGCVGSREANMRFFDDCRFVIQCDRRGNSDFINNAGGTVLCSPSFINDAKLESFGYKCTVGALTDVKTLKSKGLEISCCNMSCGYYNPHTETEMTDFNDLLKCQALVEHMVTSMTKVYPHKAYYGSPSYYQQYSHSMPNARVISRRDFDEKELSEQEATMIEGIKEYIRDSAYVHPYNYYQENKHLFPGIGYARYTQAFNRIQEEVMTKELQEMFNCHDTI